MNQSIQGVYLDRSPKAIVGIRLASIRLPRIKPCKYDGMGSYAANSSTPPWGWPITFLITAAVVAGFIFGFAHVGAAAGLT